MSIKFIFMLIICWVSAVFFCPFMTLQGLRLAHSYLKRWIGLPSGASWLLVHDIHGLNIKSFAHLYDESRSLNLSTIRLFGDNRGKHALDSKEKRESGWVRKFSSAVYAKGLVGEVVPPIVQNHVSTNNESLDDSLASWSS